MGKLGKRLTAIFIIFLLFTSLSTLFAFAATGPSVSSVWSYDVPGKTFSPPVAANKMVYFYSDEGVVYAIDSIDSKLKWIYKIEKESKEKLSGGLTVKGGMVYVLLNNGRLVALNAYSGQKEWIYTGAEGGIYPPVVKFFYYTSSVFCDDNSVYLTAPNGVLHALNKNGKKKWTYKPNDSYISSPPTVFKDTVYVGTHDGKVCAVNIETGRSIWISKFGESYKGIFFAPIAFDGTVFVGSSDNKVYALDAKSGELKWSYNIGNEPSSSPGVSSGNIYIGSSNGELIALDADNGEIKWVFYVEGFLVSSPTIDDIIIYIGSNDGKLYALDARTGESYWAYETGGYYVTSATIAKDMVYVGANVKEKGAPSLKIFAFKKGLSAGTLVRVIGRKESVFAKKAIGQIVGSANYMLSNFGDKKIDNISTWPFGLILRFAEQNKAKQIDFAETPKAEKEASKIILRYTPAASIVGYFCASMMTPIAPIIILSSIICCWGVLLLLLLYTSFGKNGLAVMLVSSTESGEKEHLTKGSYFRALRYTFANYSSILINFLAGYLVLLFSWILVDYFYPIFAAWLFYFLVAVMWLLALSAGSFVRAFGLAYVLKRGDQTSLHLSISKFKEVFKVAKDAFGRVFLLSGWYAVWSMLSIFCLVLAQIQHSYLVFFLGLILVLLTMLAFFADTFIVFENISFTQAIIRSIGLSFRHPLKLSFYVIFMGLILILATLVIFNLFKLPFGYLVSLGVCALVSAYLTNLHGLLYLKITERDSSNNS